MTDIWVLRPVATWIVVGGLVVLVGLAVWWQTGGRLRP
jgi:hypothetical protein